MPPKITDEPPKNVASEIQKLRVELDKTIPPKQQIITVEGNITEQDRAELKKLYQD